jgi:hypothetical protein
VCCQEIPAVQSISHNLKGKESQVLRKRLTAVASVGGFVLLAACEQSITRGPVLAPAPNPQITAAADLVGAPRADVERASAVLAARVPGGASRAEASGSPAARAQELVNAAAFAARTAPENLPAVARAVDEMLRLTIPGQPVPR